MHLSKIKIAVYNRWLLRCNLLLLCLITGLILSSDRIKTALHLDAVQKTHHPALDYRANPFYPVQLEMICHQRLPAQIVFLGTSLCAFADWRELLGRCDVSNQGIRNDVAAGIAARITEVVVRKPVICFVEAGINDVSYNIPAATTLQHLRDLVDSLRSRQVVPVLHTVTKVTDFHPNKAFNAKVNDFNDSLRNWCAQAALELIDLDKATDSAGYFQSVFATSDGSHYTYRMYRLWAGRVKEVLQKHHL